MRSIAAGGLLLLSGGIAPSVVQGQLTNDSFVAYVPPVWSTPTLETWESSFLPSPTSSPTLAPTAEACSLLADDEELSSSIAACTNDEIPVATETPSAEVEAAQTEEVETLSLISDEEQAVLDAEGAFDSYMDSYISLQCPTSDDSAGASDLNGDTSFCEFIQTTRTFRSGQSFTTPFHNKGFGLYFRHHGHYGVRYYVTCEYYPTVRYRHETKYYCSYSKCYRTTYEWREKKGDTKQTVSWALDVKGGAGTYKKLVGADAVWDKVYPGARNNVDMKIRAELLDKDGKPDPKKPADITVKPNSNGRVEVLEVEKDDV